MAYENVELVIAMLSGDVYMARINKDGSMDTRNRRIATDDVLRAAGEWFIANKKAAAHFKDTGWLCWIPKNEKMTTQDIKEYINKISDMEGTDND